MKTIDLSRIPEVYRERVQREMSEAYQSAADATDDAHPPWTCQEVATNANLAAGDKAADGVLARYLKIADEAEGAAARQYAMTRAGGGYTPGDEIPETMRLVCEGGSNAARAKVWADELAKLDAPAEAFTGTWILPAPGSSVLTINDDNSLHMVLDAIARYLAEPRDGLPVELTLNVIRLLALSLPRGLLAPAEHQAHTLAALAALVKTIPGNRWPGPSPRLDLATWDAASVARVAALPKAHAFAMPYEQQQMLDVAIANVDGLEVKAQHRRPMTDAERLGLGGGS